jgi:hypothetical protein
MMKILAFGDALSRTHDEKGEMGGQGGDGVVGCCDHRRAALSSTSISSMSRSE